MNSALSEEQKKKLYEIVDIMEGKAPREALLLAVEKIANMNENQLEGLIQYFELLNELDVDNPYPGYEKTTNH